MFVRWIQHAAGHGGFHTGHARLGGDVEVSWIFDCESRSTAKFDALLKDWTACDGKSVDWLFTSHFDTDHVSGLETLMSRKVVHDVMVPFVNEGELAYVMLHEIGRGNLSRAFFELLADPADYFIGRGATRVTFFGSPPEGGPEEPGARPEGPVERDGLIIEMKPWPKPIPRTSRSHERMGQSVRVQGMSGGEVRMIHGEYGIRFRPYRASIENNAHTALYNELRLLVGAKRRRTLRPGLGDLAIQVAHLARTTTGRARLNGLFGKYVGSPNRASLSLLSMPIVPEDCRCRWSIHALRSGRMGADSKVAWLNTGDAELLRPADLEDWSTSYGGDLDHVRMLSLPHHGSDRNSNHRLQHLCPDALLAVHVKEGARKHPGVASVAAAGGRLVKVTGEIASEVSMDFRAF